MHRRIPEAEEVAEAEAAEVVQVGVAVVAAAVGSDTASSAS
jgi:hypothetical protein